VIDPKAQVILDATNAGPPLDEMGIEGARGWSARRRRVDPSNVERVVDVAATTERPPLRVYQPNPSRRLPTIIFAHGGGWILGSLDSADEACRRIARYSGCAVVSVDYRLAPEFPHPAAVVDVCRVVAGLDALAEAENLDVSRVALAGESSGAHVALAAAMALTGHRCSGLKGLLLVCPPIDRTMATASWHSLGDGFIPRRSQMKWMWDLYLGAWDQHAGGAPDPAVDTLTGLPPSIVVVAEYDPLRDEGLALAQRMRDAGVATEVIEARGQIHPVIGHAPLVEACDEYTRQVATAIAARMTGGVRDEAR
jgi:acetyl esterase